MLLQGSDEGCVCGIYGLLVGCLGSPLRCCYPTASQVPGTSPMLQRGWGTWGSRWCFCSRCCLTLVALGSCIVLVLLDACEGPGQRQLPMPCSLGMALPWDLDPDLHFKATSVGLWAFSQCVAAVSSAEPRSVLLWVCLIQEPAPSRCRNWGTFLDLD